MNTIKKSGLLLVVLFVTILAITSIVMARESESAVQTPTGNSDALAIALAHLEQNKAALGLTAADLAEARVSDTTVSRLSGVTTIYLNQQLGGIEVFNGLINISIMPNGDVLTVGNRFVSDLAGSVSDRTASISAEQAVQAAAAHVELTIQTPLQTIEQASGSAQETLFSNGGISQNPIPAKLVYDASGKAPRLAWNVIIYQLDSLHWWNVRVDANTGEILSKNDWVVNENFDAHVGGGHGAVAAAPALTNAGQEVPFGPTPVADGSSYRVYHIPVESPIHTSPAPPADGRTLENTPADAVGSPFGWHDTNGAAGAEFTTTQGNNAHAYTDTDANNTPDPGSSPDGGAGLDFDFPLDLTQPPSAYRPAAVTNLFHWNNLIHDVNYRYGFDEVHGNFQTNNYGNGGLGNDYVFAEAQDGSGTNNANFSTPPDGSNPRMQMYIWTAPTPDLDGDLDNGIIAHEYGHGISNRMVGGPSNVGCLSNAEQMGEGWSDWQSVIMTMENGDLPTDPRGVGTYALNQPPDGPGIRPAPYTTDMTVNTYTYSNLPAMAIPHGVGFVWNTMLWEVNWGLIEEHGFNEDLYLPNTPVSTWSGNQLAHALVTEGFNLTPCSPGFVDGRNAILAADVALTGGQNACIIWEAFAKRGLGFSASQGSSSSTSDGTAAFDMPQSCLTLGVDPTSNDICQGQTAVYTVDVGTAFTPPVDMSATGNPAPSTATFNPDPVITVPDTTDLTIGNTGSVAAGSYTINILGDDGVVTDTVDVDLNVFAGAPGSAPTLVSPPNGSSGVALAPTLTWGAVANTSIYHVDVATDAAFTNIVYSADEATTSHTVGTNLNPTTTYYWRVQAENPCGNSAFSTTFNFTTVTMYCSQPNMPIPDDPDVSDTINIPDSGNILDVDVYIDAAHTWVGDLIFTLTHNATNAVIIDRPGRTTTGFGCSGNDYDVTVNDEGADGDIESQCADSPAIFGDRVGGDPANTSLLSVYDGMDVTGDWTLTISDAAGGDTGNLNEWCIIPAIEPAGYSISLNKTVGTDPSVCAATDSVLLPPGGGDVTYCYTVTNTGLNDLTAHTLIDDQLGVILNNFAYTLVPGASAFITQTATITTTTVNVAEWTASDGGNSVSATDDATVTVQTYLPEIETDPDATSAQPADTVYTRTFQISNVGQVTPTLLLGGDPSDLVWSIAEETAAVVNRPAAPIFGSPALAASANVPGAAETVADGAADGPMPAAPETVTRFVPQGGVLYDNGPLVNSPGTGPGGADESLLQDTSLGMTIYGFGHQIVNNNSMADDFTIPAGEQWAINTITFFAYQTGSTTTSTITGMNVDIYDGDPSAGGTIIASSTTMLGSVWSGIYRGLESAPGNTQRPIMATEMDFGGLTLSEGTYWIEWQASGSLASGPWAPPITINGQTTTGNGLQNLAGTWGAAIDVGQQGLPFIISGTSGCSSDIPWLSVSPTSGTTPVLTSSDVNVTFDSTGLSTGVYTGTMCISSNDIDESLLRIPVTLTVVVPTYGVALSADDAASGNAGETVTYTVSVTNLANVDDVIDLTASSAGGWSYSLSANSVSLAAGESADITVVVTVPAGASDGDTDALTITATSQGDASATDTAVLTTTAVVPPPPFSYIYLPIILKP